MNAVDGATTDLPRPIKPGRWHPLRSGILNLYRYTRQEFWFEHGHLLLRGNNGTGKSRVLALQLPFLLDGDTSSSRVEPDADPAKRMEWNVLMDALDNRTGYTWIEFGRTDEHGDERFLTLGCGLHATRGSDLKKWFFITRQRIGRDLFLETENETPLTRDALREALGDQGTLHDRAGDYRRAVDDELFQLGEDRYRALVDLLIQLRKPQLSRQLDEGRLSDALSNSLPPLSPEILGEVAESFRALEGDRLALRDDEAAVEAVDAFRKTYRRYARITAGRSSEQLRAAHSRYETAQGKVREEDKHLGAATRQRNDATASVKAGRLVLTETRAEVDALRASPAMKQADQLDRLDSDCKDAASRLGIAREHVADREQAHESRKQEAEGADHRVGSETRRADDARIALLKASAEIGVEGDIGPVLDRDAEYRETRAGVAKVARRVDDGLRHLRGMRREIDDAHNEERRAYDRRQQQQGRFDHTREDDLHARAKREESASEYIEAASAWSSSLTELQIEDVDTILDQTALWCESLQPPQPLEAALSLTYDKASRTIERRRQTIQGERKTIAEMDGELAAEADQLTAGADRVPPAPHTRDAGARSTRLGAPLWRVCDFQESVDDTARAGVEAALEAAGLLDAWITPDGTIHADDEADGDAVLVPTASPCEPSMALSTLLRVDIDPGAAAAATLDEDTVGAVLARIATQLGDHHTVVTAEGQWRHNLLEGRWNKPTAEYIGAAAREQARRKRLQAITDERALLAEEDARYVQQLEDLAVRDSALQAERERCPDSRVLLAADQDCRHAEKLLEREREALLDLSQRHDACRKTLDALRDAYRQTAESLQLTRWMDDLQGLGDALQVLTSAIDTLGHVWERLEAEQRTAERARRQLAEAASLLDEARCGCETSEAELARRTREYETLRATVGASAEAIKVRLDAALKETRDAEASLEDAQRLETKMEKALARCEERQRAVRSELAQMEAERAIDHDAFRAFLSTRILDEAEFEFEHMPDLQHVESLAVNPAVEIAREIARTLPGDMSLSEDAIDRVTNDLARRFQELQTALTAHHHSPMSEIRHGITVVTCPYQGKDRSMNELQRCLRDEVTQRKALLDATEREFIEKYLLGEVAHHLHDRIVQADSLVADMNAELNAHPTSTGMRLRFDWSPCSDGPSGLAEVRKLLSQTQEILTPDQRDLLAGFLQQRIREVREGDAALAWRASLEQAVDYRRWHTFAVERQQSNRWQRLTRRTHGTGSGGEKAILLTIPQFAAAAAHYHAIPQAPRLIMLDEAFVGIDSDMRSQCMDLLHQFDLDFVMTSEREWGCYPSTRGLAIYQLATRQGINAIGLTRWVWNGNAKLERPTPPPARPTAAKRDAQPDDQTELFGVPAHE